MLHYVLADPCFCSGQHFSFSSPQVINPICMAPNSAERGWGELSCWNTSRSFPAVSLLSSSPLQGEQKFFLGPCRGAAPIFNWIQTACSHVAALNPSLASTQCPEALSLACSRAQLPPSKALHPPKLQHCLSQWMILSTNKSCCRELS